MRFHFADEAAKAVASYRATMTEGLRLGALGPQKRLDDVIAAYNVAVERGMTIPTILSAAIEAAKR